MRLSIVYLIFVLASCGVNIHKGTNPAFQSYLTQFETDYHVNLKNYPVNFKDLSGSTVGSCIRYSNGYREVVVDPVLFMELSENEKLVMIYHELGHCVFNRPHDNMFFIHNGKSIPRSIMYEYVLSDSQYVDNEIYYKNELVKNRR